MAFVETKIKLNLNCWKVCIARKNCWIEYYEIFSNANNININIICIVILFYSFFILFSELLKSTFFILYCIYAFIAPLSSHCRYCLLELVYSSFFHDFKFHIFHLMNDVECFWTMRLSVNLFLWKINKSKHYNEALQSRFYVQYTCFSFLSAVTFDGWTYEKKTKMDRLMLCMHLCE